MRSVAVWQGLVSLGMVRFGNAVLCKGKVRHGEVRLVRDRCGMIWFALAAGLLLGLLIGGVLTWLWCVSRAEQRGIIMSSGGQPYVLPRRRIVR